MGLPEILAPVGSEEMLTAAVRCGANAVYLGMQDFNARRNAANFDLAAFERAVRYCHARNVKVHLTLNTLVSDEELSLALERVSFACQIGVDAIIVQDLGLASLIRQAAPGMPLHASTQMSIHSRSGVELLQQMGFTRAVLARELSFDELRDIAKDAPLELEVFVHGALCMSVSGQCYLSSLLGCRSGNRGLCAQPCRLPFLAPGGTGHDLSLKDLSIIEHLRELAEIGIDSFKIEGRMKRPEYVAAAVTACRQSLAGELEAETMEKLRAVFSRSGFTDGYYTGKRGRDMFGFRQQEDVVSAKPVLASLANLYHKEKGLLPVTMIFQASLGQPCRLEIRTESQICQVESEEVCESARTRPLTVEMAEGSLKKCGGSQFYTQEIICEIEEGVSVPAARLNQLRRKALEKLSELLSQAEVIPFHTVPLELPGRESSSPKRLIRLSSLKQLPITISPEISQIILPLETNFKDLFEQLPPERIILELPRGMFGLDDKLFSLMRKAKEAGITTVLANNLGEITLARRCGLAVMGGIGLNVFNSHSANALKKLGVSSSLVSFELDFDRIKQLKAVLPIGLVEYGRLPLMLTRNCPLANGEGCSKCSGGGVTDRKKIFFPISCRMGVSELYNSRPLYLADRLRELPKVDFTLLYFTSEAPGEVSSVLQAYREGLPSSVEFTRGLYYKKIY